MPALILQTVHLHVSHIYLRARSQDAGTRKENTRNEDNTSGLADEEMLTAGPGPRVLKRGKGDVFRWNPESGLNRSNLTTMHPLRKSTHKGT